MKNSNDCLPIVRIVQTTASEWGVPIPLSDVPRAPGAECEPRQEQSQGNACGHRQIPRGARARGYFGVRVPEAGETGLSPAEVIVAMRMGGL